MGRMLRLRPLTDADLAAASDLCLRSKAHWGYDAAFMEMCREELTLAGDDLVADQVIAADRDGRLVGVAQVCRGETGCCLEKLFVDPDAMGQGIGGMLFEWAVSAARELGADTLSVEADPDAVPFYEKQGCRPAGMVASGSIPGRQIPRLVRSLA